MTTGLAGRTVVVTRDEDDDGPLGRALAELGAVVQRLPVTETAPPEDPGALAREWKRASRYDWLFATSARAARAVAAAVAAAEAASPGGRTAPGDAARAAKTAPRPRLVAAVGAGTAAALAAAGLSPDLTGEEGATALVTAMAARESLRGARILFPASDRAREEGPAALAAAGADVTKVIAYRILARAAAAEELRAARMDPAVHALTFTSPSAVAALGPREGTPTCRIAAIGPTTAAALRDLGWTDLVVAPEPGFPSLARALADAFRTEET